MHIYDLIKKKRDNIELSKDEINYMVENFVSGKIKDYQMSAMLMAIYFNSMTKKEIFYLTDAMAKSGDMVDLSKIEGEVVDKHSTGGVGDKTTLIISPIVASYGVKVAKMSGRGLGHTGGTLDKLESIPGFKIELDREEFFKNVNDIGLSVIGQTGNIAPADKKLYALRDVTCTVDSIPLIASSIMSKKIASGAKSIVLDCKMGSGAFMKDIKSSIELAKTMVEIGENANRNMIALITNMDIPLGHNIGNNLEVIEAIEILNGRGDKDLRNISIHLAGNMLYLSGKGDIDKCIDMAENALDNKKALEYFKKLVKSQDGDVSYIENPEKFKKAEYIEDVFAEKSGYISRMDTEKIGQVSTHLGAGRLEKEDAIDYSAGIKIYKKTSDRIEKGEKIATLYTNNKSAVEDAKKAYNESIKINDEIIERPKLIYARIEKDEIKTY